MKFHGFQRLLLLMRRRSTEDGIRIVSRYFATVRRAMSMPSDLRISTIRSSDRTTAGVSSSISARMRKRTASADWDRSEEHTSALQSLMRNSNAVLCSKEKKPSYMQIQHTTNATYQNE